MADGPVLIFDKSALQTLSLNEAVLMDNFYRSNITPLFFVEVLADLEKELAEGRNPDQYVSALAHKSPDMQAVANVHHHSLLLGEFAGNTVPMDGLGRPVLGPGQVLRQGDSLGIVFNPSPEEESLQRWQSGQFSAAERDYAKAWRKDLSASPKETAASIAAFVSIQATLPTTFAACKNLALQMITRWDQRTMLKLGLALVGVREPQAQMICQRWESLGQPRLGSFAPYFCHVCSVDLTFYLATNANLIRNADRPSNKVDIAYLYYLPFCTVFTSVDRLHQNLAPLFLGPMQTFIPGTEMKEELGHLNSHYLSLPEIVRERGLIEFAKGPPDDAEFLTTKIWDKYMPGWRRTDRSHVNSLSEEAKKYLIEEVHSWTEKGEPVDPNMPVSIDECEAITVTRQMRVLKGSYRRVSPEIEESERASPRGK